MSPTPSPGSRRRDPVAPVASRRTSPRVVALLLMTAGLSTATLACRRIRAQLHRSAEGQAQAQLSANAAPAPFTKPAQIKVVEPVWDGGYKGKWQNWGWAPHEDVPNGPARIDMSGWRGWISSSPGLTGEYGGLVFRYKAPKSYGDFLEVRVESDKFSNPPHVRVVAPYATPANDGWIDVYVPMDRLNPDGLPVDRVVFFVTKNVDKGLVEFDKIGLTAPPDPKTLPPPPVKDAAMAVQCGGKTTAISPMIYGIALDFAKDSQHTHQWQLGATARRWGGNPASRYNWEIGHAWNTALDWYWENVNYTGKSDYTYQVFLRDDAAHGVKTALTVPMLGWVAKDTTSVSFPKSVYPEQSSFDPWKGEAGNGKTKDDKPIPPGPPTRTSVAASPEFIKRWIEAIRREDQRTGTRSVHQYILDNEPALWNSTHRDVHPNPLTYDELLEKTIAYGTAIRQADPDAVIAGPAEWGWPNYFYSSKDMDVGYKIKPDRRMHGDVPIVAWYLQKLREHEQKTGVRILDVLDLHFYPQGQRVYSQDADRATALLRLRQTRGLWDPSYTDESWIADAVKLLPRMREWIRDNYPGRGMSIGEWSFGGEEHISGGLATAEALGRFGQNEVTSAFYWTYPADRSPAFWAFRAYRNFDGKGGHFEDLSVPASAPEGASLFASKDPSGKHVVLVALNTQKDAALRARIDVGSCGAVHGDAFTYTGGHDGFKPPKPLAAAGGAIVVELPPWSITVLDLRS